jgi:hypothetical protein
VIQTRFIHLPDGGKIAVRMTAEDCRIETEAKLEEGRAREEAEKARMDAAERYRATLPKPKPGELGPTWEYLESIGNREA